MTGVKKLQILFVVALILVGGLAVGELRAEPLHAQLTELLESRLRAAGSRPVLKLGEQRVVLSSELLRFYRQRDYAPAWISERGKGEAADSFVRILHTASEFGLSPEDYHLDLIEQLGGLIDDAGRYDLLLPGRYFADLELLLCDAFLRYVYDVTAGRVSPEAVMEGWHTRPRRVDAVKLLRYVLKSDRLEPVLDDMVPPHFGFYALMESLADLRRVSASGGWPRIPGGAGLRQGDEGRRVALLNRRLQASGDLVPGAGARFTAQTRRAVARFQRRHGLASDGVVGAQTLSALNVPVEARIRQIELNMERWRWLPRSLGDRHLQVNIAEFRLRAVESDEVVLESPVVVGTPYRRTPVFSDVMSYLEFAPYWYIPPTVLREDLLPRFISDPDYLKAHHYEMTDWKGRPVDPQTLEQIDWSEVDVENLPGLLRQKPGPWNPLGRVKFMFPNRFAVYIHDTPARGLFDRRVRSYSSGCIRVERPVDLAMWLLQDQKGWDRGLIEEAMRSETTFRVDLDEAVPVHILYWTAWVDEEGILNFRPDYYLRDAALEDALRRARADP